MKAAKIWKVVLTACRQAGHFMTASPAAPVGSSLPTAFGERASCYLKLLFTGIAPEVENFLRFAAKIYTSGQALFF
jgi:hypothetical protein